MTSERQVVTNFKNSRKSCGPKTQGGKQRSRRNALRHGLCADTVIGVLEDPQDYRAFEAAIIGDFSPQSIVERELVLRFASLSWRLRRATSIETTLFEIQGEIQRDRKSIFEMADPSSEARARLMHSVFGIKRGDPNQEELGSICERDRTFVDQIKRLDPAECSQDAVKTRKNIARCFLRLANLDNGLFERIGRYEGILWRQVMQILVTLEAIRRPSFTPLRLNSELAFDHLSSDGGDISRAAPSSRKARLRRNKARSS